MSHLDEGTLHALLDGEVPSTEAAPLQRHLADCSECQARLTEAREFRDLSLGMLTELDAEPAGAGAAGGALLFESVPAFAQRGAAAAPAPASAASVPLSAPAPGNVIPSSKVTRRRLPRWATGIAWAATIVLAVGLGYSVSSRRNLTTSTDVSSPAELAAGAAAAPTAETSTPTPLADQADSNQTLARSEAPRLTASRRRAQPATTDAARDDKDAAGPARAEQRPAVAAAAPPPEPVKPAPAPPKKASEENESKADSVVANLAPARKAVADTPNGGPQRSLRSMSKRERDSVFMERMKSQPMNLSEVVVTGAAAPASRTIDADAAIRQLGGSIRLIDGWTPVRYESRDSVVRVRYNTTFGPVVLEQWRDGNTVAHRLETPDSAPADSISAWRERIR